ncbi:MAG: glycoside hydrolase family 13 protein [Oscillospiraceae bacterium]|nr:glycoside hydrolase family 13 protein [Oscillospiraceae bacterium]
MHIPYLSRKEYHKFPYGAVEIGTQMCFRIVVPRGWNCKGATLYIWEDDKAREPYAMDWDCLEGEGEEWWKACVTLEKSGLYHYHFVCDLGQGAWSIGAGEKGQGQWGSVKPFSFTVYSDEFDEPTWLYGGTIYQIFPDRFYNSGQPKENVPKDRILREDWGATPYAAPVYRTQEADENGVSPQCESYDFFGGDLAGIIQKLPYLQGLGVSCIYLNPIFEANSNHRYDTADYSKIDPLLGKEEDFTALCKAAKNHGISVMLDGVFSHTGADSVYFNRAGRYGGGGAYRDPASPYRQWYKFTEYPRKYSAWWGVDILPEVVEENESFQAYIMGIARKWLKAGASSWRLDVADELPDCFLDDFTATVKGEKSDAYVLGEVWEDASCKISYSQRRRYLQGKQLDSVMNYPLAEAILNYAKGGCANALAEVLETLAENYPPRALHLAMNHIGTHDTVRALTLLGDGVKGYHFTGNQEYIAKKRLKIASLLQYTLPGIPCLYYGDEAGLQGGKDPMNRSCFPWGMEDKELTQHYQMLGKLRRENPIFRRSPCRILEKNGSRFVFERYENNEVFRVEIDGLDYKISNKKA